ncbi:protein NATD1-like [Styela clava]
MSNNLISLGKHLVCGTKIIRLNLYSTVTKAMSNQNIKVIHLPEEKQFIAEIGESKEKAHIDYEVIGDGIWDLQHTLVPESFRGQGVAKVLAKSAFDHVVKEDLKMKLTCWYLQGFADKNPEYKDRIVN